MKKQFQPYIAIAEGFAKLLNPLAEVVIHNLTTNQIVAIFNPFSRRVVGDHSYLDPTELIDNIKLAIIGPYEKINHDGRKLKSISLVLRNENKKAIGLLCINLDVSIFDKYSSMLTMFLSNNDDVIPQQKESLFKLDLYENINTYVQTYCYQNNLNFETLRRNEKRSLILELKEKGALAGKNATSHIASILNVSRATVYNYLKD